MQTGIFFFLILKNEIFQSTTSMSAQVFPATATATSMPRGDTLSSTEAALLLRNYVKTNKKTKPNKKNSSEKVNYSEFLKVLSPA